MRYEVQKCANGWIVNRASIPGSHYDPVRVHVFNKWAEVAAWLEKQFAAEQIPN